MPLRPSEPHPRGARPTRRAPGIAPRCALAAAALVLFALGSPARAQVGDPVTPRVHAITNTRIVVAPGRVIERGTVVIRDGLIEAVGAGLTPPADARLWPGDSLTVYAGLIDPYLVLTEKKEGAAGATAAGPAAGRGRTPRPAAPETKGIGADNPKIRPELQVTDLLPLDKELLEARRAAGFTLAQLVPPTGILRGQTALVALGDGSPRGAVLKAGVAQATAFDVPPGDGDTYPGSLMGCIALLRQTFYDAQWYAGQQADYAAQPAGRARPETNAALAALAPTLAGRVPLLFLTADNLNMLRAARLAAEFQLPALLDGSGHEYQRLDALKALNLPIFLPVDFPPAPKLKNAGDERAVDTADLRHWALAAANPGVMEKAGLRFALTADDLKEPQEFRGKVREAIARGLSADRALAACTSDAAALLGVADRVGTVEAGKVASLVVVKGDLFGEKSEIRAVWVDGRRYDTTPKDEAAGGGRKGGRKGRGAEADSARADGAGADRKGDKVDAAAAAASAAREIAPPGLMGDPDAWRHPLPAQPAAVLVRNARIWTEGPAGRLEKGSLLVKAGRIVAVGADVAAPADALVIDANGKDVTPGLIDCHSHTAISGNVNEGTNNVTAEVRIGDVVNSETVNIYRELAGGLTCVNLLHGSANAIGGQNQVIKMRWGQLPEALKFAGAIPGIKFALGENPKQSNWGIENPTRYPQTRMGVEELIRERFAAARDYENRRDAAAARKLRLPRRDLQLDAISEILKGQRLIHSHSYRADEILMLVRLCDTFGVKIGTFQHVLEGYKVADEIAAQGAGGSCFSDWWAYKFEVYDAIPWNGALMRDRGVTVSFNSDSSELARRMNTEAAKAIKYGRVPDEEALKFVTLNPARQLRIDNRVGSLEVGKDADFVLWSGDPLSNLSLPLQTWVDGRKFFDRAEDIAARPALAAERAALIGWAKKGADEGGGGGAGGTRWHPGDIDADGTDEACHDDGTHRALEVRQAKEAGR